MTAFKAQLDEKVWVDPDRVSGEPCFKGTRVPIQALIDHIEGNSTLEEFLRGFPSVSREQAIKLTSEYVRFLTPDKRPHDH
jgi:uncharacterized protein (DUF433 family)